MSNHKIIISLTIDPTLNKVFDEALKLQSEYEAAKARAAFTSNFRKMNMKTSYNALFEIMWYTQLPCFDVEGVTSKENDEYGMLKGCFWKGVKIPCSKIFKAFPTDQGMCCTFNMDSAEKMFKEGKYQDMFEFLQQRDQNLSFDRLLNIPNSWENNQEPVPEPGRSKGLQIILDSHSNLMSGGTVQEDFDGFFAIIDATDQYPMTTRKSVLIRPGHNNFVSMSATKIKSIDIESIKPLKRNCLFPGDMKMDYHNNYTQANCMLECQLEFALSKVSIRFNNL